MITIKNRKDIKVPFEYQREFEIPDNSRGSILVERIRKKCGNDWKYLDLTGLVFASYSHIHRTTLKTLT